MKSERRCRVDDTRCASASSMCSCCDVYGRPSARARTAIEPQGTPSSSRRRIRLPGPNTDVRVSPAVTRTVSPMPSMITVADGAPRRAIACSASRRAAASVLHGTGQRELGLPQPIDLVDLRPPAPDPSWRTSTTVAPPTMASSGTEPGFEHEQPYGQGQQARGRDEERTGCAVGRVVGRRVGPRRSLFVGWVGVLVPIVPISGAPDHGPRGPFPLVSVRRPRPTRGGR